MKVKAKPIEGGRVPKMWRIAPKALEALAKIVKKKKNLSESEIIELALYDYETR